MTDPISAWLSSYPPLTQGLYGRTLANFIATTNHPVDTATQDHVTKYAAAISEQAVSTQATKINVLASFFAYLVKTGRRADNPMVALAHRPKVDKQGAVKWLTLDEQRAVLEADRDEANATRNRAMLWLLLHGLRLAELISLDVENLRGDEIRFSGKGGKSRIVPLAAPARAALGEYLGPRKSGPMFRVARHRISRRQVQRIVQSWTGLHPHAMRHSFATRHIKAGTGVPQLQKLMGHQAMSSTNLYVHLDTEDVREAMEHDPLNERKPLTMIEGGKVKVAG